MDKSNAPEATVFTPFESALEGQHQHCGLDDGMQSALLINPQAGIPRLLAAAQARMQAVGESIGAWLCVEEVGQAQLHEILRSHDHLVEETTMLLEAISQRLYDARGCAMADSTTAVVIPLPTAAAEPVVNPPRGKGRTPKVVVPAWKLNHARGARKHYAVLAKISAARQMREEQERLEGLLKARAFLDAQIADVQNRIRP